MKNPQLLFVEGEQEITMLAQLSNLAKQNLDMVNEKSCVDKVETHYQDFYTVQLWNVIKRKSCTGSQHRHAYAKG